MNKSLGRAWWAALSMRRRSPALDHHDFADMGTAFGLDASQPLYADDSKDGPPPIDTASHLANRLRGRTVL